MPEATAIDPTVLKAWEVKDSKPEHQGPLEYSFQHMFSIGEMMESHMSLDGAVMGKDPHFDARQTLMSLAKMVDDKNTTRALIQLEDMTEAMLVDVVPYDDVMVKVLPGSGDPMVLARVAYHTGNPNRRETRTKKIADAISSSMPLFGAQCIKCCSIEEMKILKSFFDVNHNKLWPQFRKQVEADLPQELLQIPGSFTSYFCPLYIRPPEKTPKEKCLACGEPGKHVCAKCKVARYCSRKCQTEHWKAVHKKMCSTPEEKAVSAAAEDETSAADGDAQWVDINPQDTPQEMRCVSTISLNQSRTSNNKKTPKISDHWLIFDDIRPDKMMVLKVQIQPGSSADDGVAIMIYPERKKFQLLCVPANTVNGHRAYSKLHNTVKIHGIDAGLGMGGCKAYINGYITKDGLLRIMINDLKPVQHW